MKIIDAHSNLLPEKIINNAHFFSNAWSDIEAQIRIMDNCGIVKVVPTYPTTDAHLKLGSISEVAEIKISKISRPFLF